MGIQDRDYMRERSRKAEYSFEERRDRPFAPPRQGASMLVMVLTWIAAALLLYRGYEWIQTRHDEERVARARKAAAMNMRQAEARREQVSTTPPTVTSGQIRSNARIERIEAFPPGQSQPLQVEERQSRPQTGGTIYLCKAYNGGTFWAQAHCGQHHALIDSIVPVPAGLPFEQQVQLAQQQRQAKITVQNTTVNVNAEAARPDRGECKRLDARVEELDAWARQPQSAQMQDWIRGQRQAVRDRQFALHC